MLALRNRMASRRAFVHTVGQFRMELDLDLLIDNAIYYMGTWEPEVVAAIRRTLRPGGVAVDVGAHSGFMTLHMAHQVGPTGRVLAFEPTSWAYERLTTNVELNGFHQVTARRAGLSDAPAVTASTLVPTSYPLVGERPHVLDSLVIETLDAVCTSEGLERLDFVKCDTDGWEAHVMRGARETLRRFRPVVLFEVNPTGLAERGETVAGLVDLVRDLGYGLYDAATQQPLRDVAAAADRLSGHHDLDVLALPEPV